MEEKKSRKPIIIGIVVLLLVTVTLLGVTYAYYRTRIIGNDADTSISVTSQKLELTYSDGNGTITSTGVGPGDSPVIKEFSIINNGDSEVSYVVTLDDVVNGISRIGDLVYKLECNSTDNNECNGIGYDIFPNSTSSTVLVGNKIASGTTHNYKLMIYYKEMSVDQSIDMDKTFSAKVNIKDIIKDNPYSVNTSTLAYNVVNNAINNANGTELVATPPTKLQTDISGSEESVLSVTGDDYGTSYYFRGNVQDNYVNFAGMCWRIVRIQGDGSVRLILEDQYTTCNDNETTQTTAVYTGNWSYGNNYKNFSDTKNSDGVYILDYLNGGIAALALDFQKNKLSNYLNKIKTGDWCMNDTLYANDKTIDLTQVAPLTDDEKNSFKLNFSSADYESYIKFDSSNVSLKCNGSLLSSFKDGTDMKVGMITADEAIFAGGSTKKGNKLFYLYNSFIESSEFYRYNGFMTFTPYYMQYYEDDGVYNYAVASWGGGFNSYGVNSVYDDYYALRPTVTLISGVISTGNGTISNPYVIAS